MIHPTQPVPRVASFTIRSIALCVLLMLGSVHVSAQTGAIKPGEPVTLNFTGAEIEAVARTLATLSGRNVVVDPRVKGTITLVTERPVPPAAAWNQFLATLRLQGFTVVESAGLYKVVPEADAKLQALKQAPREFIRDPVMLEFLGFPGSGKLLESRLEQALMDKLQAFLLELGKGFAFLGRQYPLVVNGKDYFLDLLFYHARLKCYVVIELKADATGRPTPEQVVWLRRLAMVGHGLLAG